MENSFFDRTLTQLDQARLQGMISRLYRSQADSAAHHSASALAELLDAAEIVTPSDVPSHVATMRSQVLLTDAHSGQDFEVLLSYPDDADTQDNRVSVLSPIGLAVLGCKVGEDAVWQGSGGTEVRARLKAVQFQPEAAGELLR